MTQAERDIVRRISASAIVMRYLPQNPGFNGSVLLIDDAEAATVAAALDEAASTIESLRAQLAERQWQPIETAPMTGRKVILFYLNRNNKARTVMARWVTDEEAAETDADDVGLEGGWYECIDNWDDYCQVAIHEGEPTHWMPLPPPPQAQDAPKADGGMR